MAVVVVLVLWKGLSSAGLDESAGEDCPSSVCPVSPSEFDRAQIWPSTVQGNRVLVHRVEDPQVEAFGEQASRVVRMNPREADLEGLLASDADLTENLPDKLHALLAGLAAGLSSSELAAGTFRRTFLSMDGQKWGDLWVAQLERSLGIQLDLCEQDGSIAHLGLRFDRRRDRAARGWWSRGGTEERAIRFHWNGEEIRLERAPREGDSRPERRELVLPALKAWDRLRSQVLDELGGGPPKEP